MESNADRGLRVEGIQFTGKPLGRGAYGKVLEAEWFGTVCAAKQLHDIFLQDVPCRQRDKLIRDFEKECQIWAALRHPNIVLLLGLYYESGSIAPTCILEKMDTSLRMYLEANSPAEFSARSKVRVMVQVTQALCYLHSRVPPLVHHDLSPNNILIDIDTMQTKVTDFGMARMIDSQALTRRSSVKGTMAFMSPEALKDPPVYNEKLDVFSFGNCLLMILTHQWPQLDAPTKFVGGKLEALSEYKRRQCQIAMISRQDEALYLKIIQDCLENDPAIRPTSNELLVHLKQAESVIMKSQKSGETETVVTSIKEKYLERIDILKDSIWDLQREKANIQEQNISLQEDLRHAKKLFSEKVATLASKEQELSNVNERCTCFERKCTLLEDDCAHFKGRCTQLEGDCAYFKGRCTQLEGDCTYFKGRCTQLEDELFESKEEASMFSRDINKLKNEFAVLKEENASLQEVGAILHHDSLDGSLVTTPSPVATSPDRSLSSNQLRKWSEIGSHQRIIRVPGKKLSALAVSPSGNIVAADVLNHRLVSIDSKSGAVQQNFGYGRFGGLMNGVAISEQGDIFASDALNGRIIVFSSTGTYRKIICSNSDDIDKMASPYGLTVAGDKVYIVDNRDGCVFVFSTSGHFESIFGDFRKPADITVSPHGLLYVSDSSNECVQVFRLNGKRVRKFQVNGQPAVIAVTPDNYVVLSYWNRSNITIHTADGELVRSFKPDRTVDTSSSAYDLAVDKHGLIYVTVIDDILVF